MRASATWPQPPVIKDLLRLIPPLEEADLFKRCRTDGVFEHLVSALGRIEGKDLCIG